MFCTLMFVAKDEIPSLLGPNSTHSFRAPEKAETYGSEEACGPSCLLRVCYGLNVPLNSFVEVLLPSTSQLGFKKVMKHEWSLTCELETNMAVSLEEKVTECRQAQVKTSEA